MQFAMDSNKKNKKKWKYKRTSVKIAIEREKKTNEVGTSQLCGEEKKTYIGPK